MTWKDIPNLTTEDKFPELLKQLKEVKHNHRDGKEIVKAWASHQIKTNIKMFRVFGYYIIKECP